MKKAISIILALIVLCGIGSLALASDVSDADYYGVIRATNNGTAVTNVCANVSINTTALIDSGFLDGTATNAAVRVSSTDVPFMPGYDGDPWVVYYDSIGQNSSSDVTLYTGNVTGGEIRYFPDTAGMTVAANETLKLGNNFTITATNMFLNTTAGADKNIIRIDDAIRVYESDTISGNVTVEIYDATPTDETLRPTGVGSETFISNVNGAATHWQAVNDTNDATYVYQNAAATPQRDLYQTANTSVTDDRLRGNINSITFYFRISIPGNLGTMTATPSMRTNSTTYDGTGQTTTGTAWVTKSQVFAVNPVTSAAWTWEELNELETGVKISNSQAAVTACSEVYIVVNYNALTVEAISTLTGIALGEYDVSVSANTTNLALDIGGTSNSTALGGASVPDDEHDLIFYENDSVMYAGQTTIAINGTPVSRWAWENGDTFHDSIGENDAIPSYKVTSSDPDVSATLLNFNPVSVSTVDDDTIMTWPTIMDEPPPLPDTMYSENTTPGIFFAAIIHSLSAATEIPESLFWYNFAFTIIVIAGIGVWYIVEQSKSSTGSSGKLFIKAFVQAAIMCAFALPGLNIYGFFVPLYYLLWAGGLFMLSRDFGW